MPDTPDPSDLSTSPMSSSARAPDHPSNRPSPNNLKALFTHHAPRGDQTSSYKEIREDGFALAATILDCCPACADTSAAVRYVRLAVMTANAAIALDVSPPRRDMST